MWKSKSPDASTYLTVTVKTRENLDRIRAKLAEDGNLVANLDELISGLIEHVAETLGYNLNEKQIDTLSEHD